ncbi:MAG TPA: hypothetical protein VFA20_23505 [Myxococcaceae bacterium]|nr:hypothetical protein [Myxococcaceae bacterium]
MRLCPTCRAPHRDGAECSFDQTPLAREEEDLLVGATAGDRFRLLRRLSEDAEGPLYRAVAEPGLSEVQVLVLYAELAPPAARTERLQELAASAAPHGRWLQRVVAFGPLAPGASTGPLFVAMEPAAPRSVEGELQAASGGVLEEPRALRLARRVAAGMAHAHERGLVHGALTTASVRLGDEDGEMDAVQVTGRWRPAPSDDAFSGDVRALGALLFQMLTGSAPGPGASVRDANPSAQVPFAVERLMQRLLERSREARLTTARGVVRALDEVGARAAVDMARGNEPRPVLPEVPDAVVQALSLALQGAGAAAARGRAEEARRVLLAAAEAVAEQASAEALAARLAAAGEDPVELRAAFEDSLAAAEHAASADRPGETEREVVLGQFALAGWLVARCFAAGRPETADRFERAFARAVRVRLERRDVVPQAAEVLARTDGPDVGQDEVRRALAAARDALEAPVMDDGQVLDDAAFERLKREAFGDEQNALSRCGRRSDVVRAVQQAIDDASESYACGDVGGAFRTYARACERLLAEVLGGPDCGELRQYLEAALQQSRQGGTEESSAWAMRRAFDGLLEMDARA